MTDDIDDLAVGCTRDDGFEDVSILNLAANPIFAVAQKSSGVER
jgi:hypothetical protein